MSKTFCGPEKLKWLSALVPEGDWCRACEVHDLDYLVGGDWFDKLRADVNLWINIIACGWRRAPWYWKPGALVTHWWIGAIYFLNVRLFGALCFNWKKEGAK